MLDVVLWKLKTKTIFNCFTKARLSEKKCADNLLDVDDLFKDLKDQLERLAVYTSEFFPEGTIAKDVMSMDDFVNTTMSIMNDEEIISDMLGEENFEAEEDKDSDVDFLIEPTCNWVLHIKPWKYYEATFSDNRECIDKCINQIN